MLEETKKKLSESNKGKILSEETKKKLSESNKYLTTAKDIFGNKMRVNKNDIRFDQKVIFGIAAKRYRFDIDNIIYFTRDIKSFIILNNLPSLKVLRKFINNGTIEYKIRKNYTSKDINGMQIKEIKWED